SRLGVRYRALDEEPAVDGLAPLALTPGQRATPAPQTTSEFLRMVPVFSALGERALEELAAVASTVKLRPGAWLFKEGAAADAVYVLRVGQLEIIRKLADSGQETVNVLTRGAVLGELALLRERGGRRASVRALRDSELIEIERERFESLLRNEPELALGLMRSLGEQLR